MATTKDLMLGSRPRGACPLRLSLLLLLMPLLLPALPGPSGQVAVQRGSEQGMTSAWGLVFGAVGGGINENDAVVLQQFLNLVRTQGDVYPPACPSTTNLRVGSITGPIMISFDCSEEGRVTAFTTSYDHGLSSTIPFPAFFTKLNKLSSLTLVGQYMAGPVPNLAPLTALRTLDLSYNNLDGTLADKLSGLAWSTLTINVRNNLFCGEVPLAASLNIKNNYFTSDLSTFKETTSSCPTDFENNCITPAGSGASCSTPSRRNPEVCSERVCVVTAWNAADVATVSTICNGWRFNSLRYSFTASSPCPSAAPFAACGGNVLLTCNYKGRVDSLKVLSPILRRATEKGIPAIISNLAYLTSLKVPYASLSSVPDSLSALVNLQHLDLSNNQITGPFPSIYNLYQLSYIDIANNRFCGALPNNNSNVIQSFYPILNISNNYFYGEMSGYLSGYTTQCPANYGGNCISLGETGCEQSQKDDMLACRQFCDPPQLNCWIKNTPPPPCGTPLPSNGKYCCRGNILGKTPICRQQTGMCIYTHNCACPCNSRMEFTAWRRLTRTDYEGQVTRCVWTPET